MTKNNTLNDDRSLFELFCDNEDSLERKFKYYCLYKDKYDYHHPTIYSIAINDSVKEFYPEFLELYDYFYFPGRIRNYINAPESYFNIHKILNLKNDLVNSIMPFGFTPSVEFKRKFLDDFVWKNMLLGHYYSVEKILENVIKPFWKKFNVVRQESWLGDLFYLSRGDLLINSNDIDSIDGMTLVRLYQL